MGFDASKELADVDLSKKTILVTGSTSGIGFATAQVLVQQGAKVYLAARNADKAAACIKRIEGSLMKKAAKVKTGEDGKPKGRAIFHQLDLTDPKNAKQSAEAFIQKEERLDVLVHCAAVIFEDFHLGANDMQHLMNVNYFSPFVFTETILPLLKKTAAEPDSDVRIVNVASDSHERAPDGFHFKSKGDFNVDYGNKYPEAVKRYGISKLAQMLWTRNLQRRLDEENVGIIVSAVHPGFVYTESTPNACTYFPWPLSSLIRIFAWLTFLNTLDGAGTGVIAAVSKRVRTEADKYKGGYLVPIGKLAEPSKQAQNDELAKELWDTTMALVKEWGI